MHRGGRIGDGGSGPPGLLLLGFLALVLATPLRAERYRLEFMGRSLYIEDVVHLGEGLLPTGMDAPPPELPGPELPPPYMGTELPSPAPEPLTDPATVVEEPAGDLGTGLDGALDPSTGDPSAAFRERVGRVYGATSDDDVLAIWGFYVDEDPALGEPERVGNAVTRYIVTARVPLGGAQVDVPDLGAGTQGALLANLGLQLRASPWGPAKLLLPAGTRITITGATDGAWIEVDTPLGRGWVSGPYLRLS